MKQPKRQDTQEKEKVYKEPMRKLITKVAPNERFIEASSQQPGDFRFPRLNLTIELKGANNLSSPIICNDTYPKSVDNIYYGIVCYNNGELIFFKSSDICTKEEELKYSKRKKISKLLTDNNMTGNVGCYGRLRFNLKRLDRLYTKICSTTALTSGGGAALPI